MTRNKRKATGSIVLPPAAKPGDGRPKLTNTPKEKGKWKKPAPKTKQKAAPKRPYFGRLVYITSLPEAKVRFALTRKIEFFRFWYNDGQNTLQWVLPPGEYLNGFWTEQRCRDLLEQIMHKDSPIQVMRFAVDGMVFFADDSIAKTAIGEMPVWSPEVEATLTEQKKKELADARELELNLVEDAKPAPLILYGTHGRNPDAKTVYAWKLNPDVPERQGIMPGDKVIVSTKRGPQIVFCLRIEEADPNAPAPERRVIRKRNSPPREE